MNRPGRRARTFGVLVAALGITTFLPAPPAYASALGLSISVPSTVSFGSFAPGARTITANLGTVTVTTTAALTQSTAWTATVSTTAFKTGGGSAAETVAAGSVSYKSGLATAQSGLTLAVCTGGQLVTAVALTSPVTAFSCTGNSSSAGGTSLSWNPQISIVVGAGNVAGTYTGTITHSVV